MAKEQFALQALKQYSGQVRFEYHPYPYSDFGTVLAEALEAAGDQNKFWEMHNAMLEDVPENLSELNVPADKVGLDIEKFNRALESGKYLEKIESSIREAKSAGVTEVALFINRKEYHKFPGTFKDLCQAIESEIERRGVYQIPDTNTSPPTEH